MSDVNTFAEPVKLYSRAHDEDPCPLMIPQSGPRSVPTVFWNNQGFLVGVLAETVGLVSGTLEAGSRRGELD